MSTVYSGVEGLVGTEKVGSHQCVALLQHYSGMLPTSNWREGVKVLGHADIKKGTAIATFVNGRYPNLSHGNHAAYFVSQNKNGLWIVDQWKTSDPKWSTVKKRFITKKGGKRADGSYPMASDNAEAFSVIE